MLKQCAVERPFLTNLKQHDVLFLFLQGNNIPHSEAVALERTAQELETMDEKKWSAPPQHSKSKVPE